MRAIVFLVLFASDLRMVEGYLHMAEEVPTHAKKPAPVALLHQGSASVSKASASIDNHASIANPWADMVSHGRPLNPKAEGHMLTDHELKPITNVACLEALQLDPTVNCSNVKNPPKGPPAAENLNAGNYPSWKDAACNSNGEYFCDPDRLLRPEDRANVTALLKKLRTEGPHITCGPQLQHDPIDKWHYEPFYLGVAIAPKNWPQHESDAQSLQSFGQLLAGRWNMTFMWDGNPTFYARCPNQAMLIILPDVRQVQLSSPSCMFLCQDKGGPEVGMATKLGLDSNGVFGGVTAGINEVYKAIAKSSPEHATGWEPVEETAGTWGTWNKAPQSADAQKPAANWDQTLWDWAQRFLFGIAVLMLAGSLIVALLVCYLAPGLAKELNKSVV